MTLTYDTQRVVKIPSNFLAIVYYVIIVGILSYLAIYGFFWKKDHQISVPIQSVVTTKVKGVISTLKVSPAELAVPKPEFYRRIWDAQDIVTPAHGGEMGGFFILTNVLITPNQTRGHCAENPEFGTCRTDVDCRAGETIKSGNGIMTGKCVPYGNQGQKTCEINAWCPVEDDKVDMPYKGKKALLEATRDFTVLIKNTIEFPALGPSYTKRNIEDHMTEDFLKNCINDPVKQPYCPTFRIGDIVERSKVKYSDVALQGGIFTLTISWNCDFDWGRTMKDCLPKYSFSRMDNSKTKISPGWNFRSTSYHDENRRTMTQQFGIKILIEVDGQGRRFDFLKFMLTIGAGLGLFALASVICDKLLKLFIYLKEITPNPWLSKFNPDMKYDMRFVNEKRSRKSDDSPDSPESEMMNS